MRDPLLQAVAGYAARHGLLSPPPRYAAVSGGVDSVVLLHALVALGQRPEVVSCDHGLRPEAADEVRFVEGLAQGLGLPCHVLRLEVGAGPDLASRARAARYAAWDALPAGDIALGHHQDDQAETVLDHLMRGAGAGGLRQASYTRPAGDDNWPPKVRQASAKPGTPLPASVVTRPSPSIRRTRWLFVSAT